MIIDYSYTKRKIDNISGHIFKGRNYRCNYVRYKSLYRNCSPGTENVELYFFEPKKEVRASALILHGLGSKNIKYLLWLGPHLASAGVSTSVLILPGNYTRVENNSISGRSYLYPDINTMYQFWEHGVIDTLSTIDLLEQLNSWNKNNIIAGYCLGGMISTIVGAIDNRINHLLFMTTGGHIPRILHQSPATVFARKMFEKGYGTDYHLKDEKILYDIYEEQFPEIKKMSFEDIVSSEYIHPLFKIDPISYAHLLDMKKVTFIDAYFDSTLPVQSRKILYNEMSEANTKILPISHVNWLPFGYFLAKYILHKLNFNSKEAKKALLIKEIIRNPLEK
ncbi:alpha/beta hydrolase [Proteiniborus sp. MB09-C3]|uniref:alpha/beta hydrolase n=1 Tax=Proteiniborus sp. MB09-C3 TaxID=3050072 RepID=UPI002556C8A3|nr:alpha/beta hydrolase [Proteiniborus sp. MB09-C3]WIV12025.1 alpha/beta hydrolase [Proteiniborus sp. MB09-C3]